MKRLAALLLILMVSPALAGPNGQNGPVQVNGALVGLAVQGTGTISGNTTPITPLASTVLELGAADGATNRLSMDTYAGSSQLVFRRADGTATSPSAVQSTEAMGALAYFGFGQTVYSSAARATFQVTAAENWSDTAQGTSWKITATKPTTVTTSTVIQGDGYGHLSVGNLAVVPAVSACGGGSPAIAGTDFAGVVTEGTTSTGCTITFAVAFAGTPSCVVTSQTQLAAFTYSLSASAIAITNTSTSGDKINWICNGI